MLKIKLALKYFGRRKLRVILTTLSVIAAVAALVAVQGLNRSIDYVTEELAGQLGGKAQLEVKAPQGGMNESLLSQVQKIEGVQTAVPYLQSAVQVKELSGFTALMGVVPEDDDKIRSYKMAEGRMPEKGQREIVVPKELLRGHSWVLGDNLQIQTMKGMQDFRLVGILEDVGVARANGGLVIIMPLDTAQKAFGMEDKISYISVLLQNQDALSEVQNNLQDCLGDDVQVQTPLGRGENTDQMLVMIKSLDNMYGFMGLFLALFVLYNSMSVAVSEQRKQIGILRALGWRRREVRQLFLIMALLIGIIGSSLGLFVGTYMAQGLLGTISGTLSEVFKISIQRIYLTRTDYTLIWLVGVLFCLISTWLPARKATVISPIEATSDQYSRVERGYARWRVAFGAILMIVSWGIILYGNNMTFVFQASLTGVLISAAVLIPPLLILFLKKMEPLAEKFLGLKGRLGVGSFRHSPRRTVVTVMPIFLGLSMAIGFLGLLASTNQTMQNWIEALLSPDIVIHQGMQSASSNQVGLPEELLDRVRSVGGVNVVDGLRTSGIEWEGNLLTLQSYDVAEWRKYINPPLVEPEKDLAFDALQEGGQIWISESLALKYDLHRGQEMAIPTPSGTIHFTIGAITKDYISYEGTLFMNRQDYIRYWGDHSIDYISVVVEPDIEPGLVRERLEENLKNDFQLQVILGSDYRKSMLELTSSLTDMFNMVILVAFLVVAVGTANTLIISALERVREIGTLRSLGLKRREIISLFMIETASLTIVGLILAIPIGAIIQAGGTIFEKNVNGWVLDVTIPWAQNMSVALAMALVALLSALYPAWLASKIDPVEALRSE